MWSDRFAEKTAMFKIFDLIRRTNQSLFSIEVSKMLPEIPSGTVLVCLNELCKRKIIVKSDRIDVPTGGYGYLYGINDFVISKRLRVLEEERIGNLTSQFFANLYLNELDYYVKHILKAKFYVRYVDDFVILHRSKEKLILYKWLITNFLKSIKLELHPEKSNVIPLRDGINLLGYKVFYRYKLLRKSNIRKATKRLQQLHSLLEEGKVSADYVTQSLNGWSAYAKVGNTYRMRKEMLKPFEKFNIKL